MTTSHQTQFLSESAAGHSGPEIPLEKRAFFQTRFRNRLFDFVLSKFEEQQKHGLTQAILARRVGKRPDVVSRLLGAPGNWTLDTVSDLLLGISAEELEPIQATSILNRSPTNYRPHEYIGNDEWKPMIYEQVQKSQQEPVSTSLFPGDESKQTSNLNPRLGKAA